MSLVAGWFEPGMYSGRIFKKILEVCAQNPCQPNLRIEAVIAWPEESEGYLQMGKYIAESIGEHSIFLYRQMPSVTDSDKRGFGTRRLPNYVGPSRGVMTLSEVQFSDEVGLARLLPSDNGLHVQLVVLHRGTDVHMPTLRNEFQDLRWDIIRALAKNLTGRTVSDEIKTISWRHYLRLSK